MLTKIISIGRKKKARNRLELPDSKKRKLYQNFFKRNNLIVCSLIRNRSYHPLALSERHQRDRLLPISSLQHALVAAVEKNSLKSVVIIVSMLKLFLDQIVDEKSRNDEVKILKDWAKKNPKVMDVLVLLSTHTSINDYGRSVVISILGKLGENIPKVADVLIEFLVYSFSIASMVDVSGVLCRNCLIDALKELAKKDLYLSAKLAYIFESKVKKSFFGNNDDDVRYVQLKKEVICALRTSGESNPKGIFKFLSAYLNNRKNDSEGLQMIETLGRDNLYLAMAFVVTILN